MVLFPRQPRHPHVGGGHGFWLAGVRHSRLEGTVDQGVFGYPIVTEAVTRAVVAWAESHYGWSIDPQWIVWIPGLVPGIHLACQTLAASGDEVLTFPGLSSVPFSTSHDRPDNQDGTIHAAGRRWTLDLDALSRAITPQTKVPAPLSPLQPGRPSLRT